MHGRHLTQKGTLWVFQMRVPRRFFFLHSLSTIRFTIGHVNKREAQQVARALAQSAMAALHIAQNEITMARQTTQDFDMSGIDIKSIRQAVHARLHTDVMLLTPLMHTSEAGIPDDAAAARHWRDLTVALAVADTVEAFADTKTPVEAQIAALSASIQRMEASSVEQARRDLLPRQKQVLLFSEAADRYFQQLLEANGPRYDELKYIAHRRAVFLEICEDKRCNEYTSDDIQHFINTVHRLPANHSKEKGFHVSQTKEIISEAKLSGKIGISYSTLVNNYLGKVKTILRYGCSKAGVPFPLAGSRFIIPKSVPAPKAKHFAGHDSLNKIFKLGVESGQLAKAMLPLLGFITSRRLGSLVYLRAEDIQFHAGHWTAVQSNVISIGGSLVRVPLKTAESARPFVLHDFLQTIGFIEWARQKSGYLFEALHENEDPADSASKSMAHLFTAAGVDRTQSKAFHGLRHLGISDNRSAALSDRVCALQAGHELSTEHQKYGGVLQSHEIKALATIRLPDDLDLSLFQNLDFDQLASARPTRGRKKRRTSLLSISQPISR
jgi:integrase